MNTPIQERRQTLIFRIALSVLLLALLIIVPLIGLETWVRWTMNKDFLFLGGFELETLTVSIFVLLLGMLYMYRPGQKTIV